jgi:hypothetical protein
MLARFGLDSLISQRSDDRRGKFAGVCNHSSTQSTLLTASQRSPIVHNLMAIGQTIIRIGTAKILQFKKKPD